MKKLLVFLLVISNILLEGTEIKTGKTINAELKYYGVSRIVNIPVCNYYQYQGFQVDNFYLMTDHFHKNIKNLNCIYNWKMLKVILNETLFIENNIRCSVNIAFGYINFIFDFDSMSDSSLKSLTIIMSVKEFYKKIY
jgi:hypothetical protein